MIVTVSPVGEYYIQTAQEYLIVKFEYGIIN